MLRNPSFSFCAVAVAFLFAAAPARAQLTFTIQPLTEAASKDAKIFTHSPTNSQSNLNLTSFDTGEHFLSLVQFDLSSLAGISADSILSATFTLYSTGIGPSGVVNPNGGSVTVSPILDAWRENTTDAGTAPVASYAAFFGSLDQDTGLTTDPTLHFGSAVATQTVTTSGFITWDITTLVKAWVSGTQANDGVIVQVPDSNTNVDIGFADVDSNPAIAGSAPSLTVNAVPEPSSIVLSVLGLAGFSIGRVRRRSLV